MSEPGSHRPRAFTVEEATPEPDFDVAEPMAPGGAALPAATAPRPRARRGWRWGWLLVSSLAGLVTVWATAALTDYVVGLIESGRTLGWIALGFAGLAVLALLAIVLREVVGLARLARLRHLREAAEAPILSDAAARRITADLVRLYAARPELLPAVSEISRHASEIIDPPDRLIIAEQALMPRLDAEARRLIADATRRVSLVTAISPAAVLDLGVVLVTHLTLIRRIAELYGGRPGMIGLMRLARLVLTHLAVTGSIALGDDVVHQVIGHGLAARLSARLGEGVLNGLMTARVGIAALDVCRPMPFKALRRPRVTDFARLATAEAPGADADRVRG